MIVTGGAPAGYRGAIPLGLHVEGPFLNPAKKGAHNATYLRPPTLEAVAGWSPRRGVRLVTMAPELPGALDVIRDAGVARGRREHGPLERDLRRRPWRGSTRARGTARTSSTPSPRSGTVSRACPGALLSDDRVTVGFIADGVHTHRSVIKTRLPGARPRGG